MMRKALPPMFMLLTLLPAYGRSEAAPDRAAATPAPARTAAPAGTQHFGAPLGTGAVTAVSAVLKDPAKYADKDLKLEGQVGAVCQKKGCWMTLGTGEPGAPSVRVRFKDYGFFVPTDCIGKRAVVEGRFTMTTLSKAEAQHYADDAAKAGQKPAKVTGPQQTLAMMATGVDLR